MRHRLVLLACLLRYPGDEKLHHGLGDESSVPRHPKWDQAHEFALNIRRQRAAPRLVPLLPHGRHLPGVRDFRSAESRPNYTARAQHDEKGGRQKKGVEPLFGVLQGRFRILRYEFHHWSDMELVEIVQTCLVLHEMLASLLQLCGRRRKCGFIGGARGQRRYLVVASYPVSRE